MSARSSVRQAAAKAVTLFGALFLVSVLLAAMPNHRAPELQAPTPEAAQISQPQPAEEIQSQLPSHRRTKLEPAGRKTH